MPKLLSPKFCDRSWLCSTAALFLFVATMSGETGKGSGLEVIRHSDNPIIRPEMLPGKDGANIHGPSLVRVPEWVPNPLGRYYLYFAHHHGHYIRLAYADSPEGPWTIHEPGALHINDLSNVRDHIASPDPIIDEEKKEWRMYFHGIPKGPQPEAGRAYGHQQTFVATSPDGLNWKTQSEAVGPFYFRVFRWQDAWYGFSKGGDLYRSPDGLTPFTLVGNPFTKNPEGAKGRPAFNRPGDIRHLALDLQDGELWAYHSRIGDSPERIQRQRIELTPDPADWKADPPQEVLRPELPYEGADVPVSPSVSGSARGPSNSLRSPGIYREGDRLFLLYSVSGEKGIGMAELIERP